MTKQISPHGLMPQTQRLFAEKVIDMLIDDGLISVYSVIDEFLRWLNSEECAEFALSLATDLDVREDAEKLLSIYLYYSE